MQSPGMAHYFGQGLTPQDALTSQYSTWHQERLYLLSALAEEESKGEHLTQILSDLQSQLNQFEVNDSFAAAKKLRQKIKAVRNKIGACQHRERALAANLANTVVQMEGLKRYQWRNAQQEYAIQILQAQQHAQMVLMSPARPQFALRSPSPMDLVSQMQYMSLGHSPAAATTQSSPQNPYLALGQINGPSQYMPSYSAYGQSQHLYSDPSAALSDLQACGLADIDLHVDDPVSPMSIPSPTQDWNARFSRRGHRRAASLLVPAQRFSASRSDSFSPRNDGAMRRLSLLDGTNAAMQLERKAAEVRSEALNVKS